MPLEKTGHLYNSAALAELPWIEHGFGTANSIDWPDPARLATLKQIHSSTIVEAEHPGANGEGDSLITNQPGLLVGVRTADCVSVLLADTCNRAVAAVHAGWKGSAQNIVARTIGEMTIRYGTDPRDVLAAIGPSIGVCCYEVGADVADQFLNWLPSIQVGRKQKLDLRETNRRQLLEAGVAETAIVSGAPCTFCQPGELHSFRRDGGRAGRMISVIGIRH